MMAAVHRHDWGATAAEIDWNGKKVGRMGGEEREKKVKQTLPSVTQPETAALSGSKVHKAQQTLGLSLTPRRTRTRNGKHLGDSPTSAMHVARKSAPF
jgi:hypothetical protein